MRNESNGWVERISKLVKGVEGAVIDLGADLYPPLDLPLLLSETGAGEHGGHAEDGANALEGHFSGLKEKVANLLSKLRSPILLAYFSPDIISSLDTLVLRLGSLTLSRPDL